jgi:egghead protein (zeste-white 4 protein)
MVSLRPSRVRSRRISAAAATADSPARRIWRPGLHAFVIAYVVSVAIGTWAWLTTPSPGSLDNYLAVFWTLPILGSAIGMYGALRTWGRSRSRDRELDPERVTSHQLLVVIPTIGRLDTLPALERVLRSTRSCLPAYFSQFRIDVVIEADCEARSHIEALARTDPYTHLIVVPVSFQTVHRTHFKARANHYANLVRLADGDVRDDVWVLHMDDDTEVRIDTAAELARFVTAQDNAGDQALDLCQGVLCYPRELANHRLVWLADAIRPGCDLSLFAATTGGGRPYAGLHGELLMVRASV